MVVKIRPGSFGVTEVEKVIFTKNATSSTDNIAVTHDLCICISLTPLYKSYGPKKISGVNWGHWGQKVILTKILLNRPYNKA